MGTESLFQRTEVESTEEGQPPSQYNIQALDRNRFASCNSYNGKRRQRSNHWQAPLDDVMEKILQRLSLKDRILLRIVYELGDADVEDYGYHGEGNDHDDIDGDVDEYYLADEATVVAEHDNENVNDLEGNHQDGQFDHEDEDYMLIKRM
ncbi:hypothetical protein ACLB2K_012569 [Fragaria x ananassa]